MVEGIMLYKLSLEKVRKKTITDAMYRIDDDVGKDCLTIVCRGRECPTPFAGIDYTT